MYNHSQASNTYDSPANRTKHPAGGRGSGTQVGNPRQAGGRSHLRNHSRNDAARSNDSTFSQYCRYRSNAKSNFNIRILWILHDKRHPFRP